MQNRTQVENQASAREIRARARKSQTAVAALAGVAPGTYRCFEIDEFSVTQQNRERCRAAVAQLASGNGASK